MDRRSVRCALLLNRDNPIVDDHRVHGVRTLPGVTFLDIVHRLLVAHGIPLEGTELNDVLFVEPVVTTESFDRELTVELVPDGAGFQVTATSRRTQDGTPVDDAVTTHLRATLRTGLPPLTGTPAPAAPGAAGDVGQVYATGRSAGIEHRAFMRCVGTLHAATDRVRAEIALGDEARATVGDFLLHPALLDGATMQSYALVFDGADADGRPFIPLHIASFRAARTLGDACTVDLRLKPTAAGDEAAKDIVKADIDLYDGSGVLAAQFTGLTFKRIRSTASITRLTTAAQASASPAAAEPAPAPATPVAPAGTDGEPADLRAEITELVRRTLGEPGLEVDPDRGFYDLGLESTHLLTLVRAIEERWDIALYPTLLFEYPTVDAVAAHLAGLLPDDPRPRAAAAPAEELPARTGALTGVWQEAPRPQAPATGPLLVIGDLAVRAGQITARRGPAFRRIAHDEYELRTGETGDLKLLLADLATSPEAVLHVAPRDAAHLPEAVESACHEVLALAKVLADRPVPVVHAGPAPVAAAVSGLARTVRLEQPRLAITAVECDGPAEPRALLAEFGDLSEAWVRHTAGRRYVRRYREAALGVAAPVRRGGVYLITGGAGGIGRELAARLTGRGATAVLAGRSPQPSPPAGHYLRADVTVRSEVDALVKDVLETYGRLDGVVHAAGVLRDGLFAGKPADDLSAVLAPKVRGTVLLDEATRHLDLDFFAVFSSVTGVAGNAGQSDYAAANAFMDAYARERGLVSLAWPLWADGGMRTDAAAEALFRRQGQAALPTADGLDVLDRALALSGTEVVVLHGDPGRAREALGLIAADPAAPTDPAAGPAKSAAAAEQPEAPEPARRAPRPAALPQAHDADGDIAVIGVAGRYPMAEDLDRFWTNLRTGRDCVTEIPAERWAQTGFYEQGRNPGRSYSKWGGFLEGIDEFDPAFFRITPREAEGMDPQERLFLQTSWHALEDAGLTRADVSGRSVGVFAGVMFTQYQMLGLGAEDRLPVLPTSFSSAVANRVSFFLDLHGPSLALDTMCSSSLTALHLACESLRSGDSELALAGGVNLIVHPYKYLHLSQVGFVSTDGRCRAFGAGGDGYVPGEGVGVVVLKPLARALEDGDRVLGVIKGSAVNHGGRAGGFFVPNPTAQADVVRRALRKAGVEAASVGYVEAHGTGTALGDPIEITALSQAYGDAQGRLGSVKSGIGHLEPAAGIAGLTKVLLQLRHRTLVPSLHADPANPGIDWDALGLKVQREAEPWPAAADGTPRRAAVSAFGAGGANAHVIVEEYPQPQAAPTEAGPQVVLLSARTQEALRELARRYLEPPAGDRLAEVAALAGLTGADPEAELDELGLDAGDLRRLARALAERFPGSAPHVDARSTLAALAAGLPAGAGPDAPLADIAYTTQIGREPMAERLAVVASDTGELRAVLRAFLDGSPTAGHRGTVTGAAVAAVPDSTDPHVLARSWAAGAAPDWRALHRGRTARKVALPLYPFARVRCWVDVAPVAPVAPVASVESSASAVPGEAPALVPAPVQPASELASDALPVDIPSWEVCAAPAVSPAPAGPVVVLHAPGREGLARELSARHEGAVLVELGAPVPVTPRLVYVLTGSTDAAAGRESDRVAAAEATGVKALARYARQWSRLPALDWVVVTTGAAAAPGRGVSDPYAAGATGFARVLENEHPGWSVATVDLDPAHESAQLVTPAPRGTRTACTGTTRHTQVLRPAPATGAPVPLRRGGTYVIIGGARGIGAAIAGRLVADWDAQVVLVGRSELPPGTRPGQGIRYVRADAADGAQLAALLDREGPVHGVVHAALVQRDRLVRNMSDEDLAESLAAKSGVAAALADALRGRHLDFLVFFSSAQSFLGDPGLANYAAGSTFLDAYAHALDARLPYPVRAVDWGFWGTVGAVAGDTHRDGLTAAGFRSITPEAGFAALLEALRQPAPQAVVVPGTAALRERMGATRTETTDVTTTDGGQQGTAGPRVVEDFHALDGRMAEIADGALLALLDDMGAFGGPGPDADADEVSRRVGVTPRYERLLHTLLDMLAQHGLLETAHGRFRPVPGALSGARAGGHLRQLAELADAHPESEVFVRLLALCLERFPELLRGELLATELLFPKSGTSLMERVYRGNPISDLYNDLLTDHLVGHVRRRLEELPADAKVRILEVGSGTGGTSAGLLRALSPFGERVEYWYTDLSVTFLAHGRREFGERYPFLRFKRLNLDSDPVAQGFPADGFDIAVAANVLHATSDVGRAVRHLRGVLRTGGELVFNELTTVTLPATVTYGLFDGWWAHDDTALRLPGSPLLDVPGWTRLLAGAGYEVAAAMPDSGATGRNFQHVVVARAVDPAAPGGDAAPASGDAASLSSSSSSFTDALLALTADASGIPVGDLDLDRAIGDYGFDSVSYSLLASRLNEELGLDVTPALFYETPTLRALADRLVRDHAELLQAPQAAVPAPAPVAPAPAPVASASTAPAAAPAEPEAIAIIGMAGRMPGSRDLDEFWQHLVAGDDLITDVPADRWDQGSLPEGVHAARGGFVHDVDVFDPLFFGISPHEAAGMDPQQRLVLQGVWTALEDAGLAPGALAGSDTGLFIGAGSSDYEEVRKAAGVPVDAHAATATTHSILVNRVSYLLDLHGPSEPVNTGCSSSLVAIHRAAESIRSGECDVAVAGGINLILSPHNHVLLSRTGMLSPTGRCQAFDARADGFVRSEGFGFVVLTREGLSRGHRVRAWLRGTAVNHGGRSRSLTAPNPAAQAAMIVRAHERAGTDPATVGYLETHGTGTELGDPVEINGLRMAFDELFRRRGARPPAEPHCGLGAVKANIGHLESAAGAAGVVKVLLAMEHAVLPPVAGLGEQNPHLRLDGSPFRLVRSAQHWPSPGGAPRRAGVSSFGYGGVNAHVVLEEAGPAREPQRSYGPWVFPLSARTPEALRRYATALLEALDRTPDLADTAHTLQHGRDAMEVRLAVTAGDRHTLAAALAAAAQGADHPALARPGGTTTADRWVAGERVEWPQGGVLVPLPTYPFERRRCWAGVDDPSTGTAQEPSGESAAAVPVVPAGRYAPRWQPVAAPVAAFPAAGPVWVLGCDEHPAADVHRIGDAPLESLPTPAAVHAVVTGEAGVLDLFRIVKHLQERPAAAGELSLTVVTRLAAAVDSAPADPSAAAALGLARSVRHECERWRVGTVDVGAADPATVSVAVPGDYALRAGQWFQEVLHPVEDAAPPAPVLREGGTYVITGGTGDLGLDIAEQLVRRHRAKVVLVARSAPDAAKAARIRAIDPSGTSVEVHRADAADPDQLRGVFERVGAVHGVLHSVTVPGDRSLAAMDEAWFTRALTAKSRTTAALAVALGDRRPDFLAVFSSVQSFLGNPGQAAYAAGCTAQDAIGHALAAHLPYPVRVLNWGAWAGSALTERHRDRLVAAGVHPLSPQAGFEALSQVLGGQEVQVAVVSGTDDFLARIGVPVAAAAGQPPAAPEPVVAPVAAPPAAPEVAPAAAPAAEGWREAAAGELLGLLCEVAGIRPGELAADDLLSRFGFDSIMYTRLSHLANARWDLDLTPAAFFGVATASDLVDKVFRDHGPALAAAFRPAAPAPEQPVPAPEPVRAAEPAPASAAAAPAPVRTAPEAAPAAFTGEPVAVAIVGMAGLLPDSDDVDEFWQHLTAGDDLVREIPADRWDWRRLHGEPEPGRFRTTAKWGGFLRRVDLFDPQFFGISPHEAVAMDPQHRLVLEAAWTAIENAGIRPSSLSGTDTGVFIGSGTYDYFELQHALGVPLDGYNTVGRAHAIMSNRVSYLLNLRGPSETVDTACSSSLVAVHRAAEAIRHGDCEVALAGGVNVIASPTLFVDMSQADMLSPDGRCRTFDASANGIVRAEGAGVVVLKRLDAAIADGDVIHAVLRGSAINHGGRTNSLTAPNPDAQAACIVKAHRRAGVDPRTVTYVETHGTGTELGDPVEVEGLRTAFAELYADHGAECAEAHVTLGAVKTNTGHLEAAAGVTGLIKVLLAMRHREIPANLHLDSLNPHLRLGGSPLRLPDGREPWRRVRTPDGAEAPLRAGVSSFGLGGVNAHLVVEEYGEETAVAPSGSQVFVLSARDPERLRAYARRLARWAADNEDVAPAALAHTLQTGRETFSERLAIVAGSLRALVAGLEAWLSGDSAADVFTGDGSDATTALLLEGAEGRRYLRSVVDAGRLDKVARLWVGGAPIDWTELWQGAAPRRVPAPTYPFARESYWLTPGPRFDAVQATEAGLVADGAEDRDASAAPTEPTEPVQQAEPVQQVEQVEQVEQAEQVEHARPAESAEPVRPAAPVAAAPPAGGDPEAAVREHVRGLLAAHLGMRPDRLPVDRVLSDAGVDSLGLRRLSRRLGADYGVQIPARMFGVAQTARAVARAVFEAYGPLPGREEAPPAPAPAQDAAKAPEQTGDRIAALLTGLRDGSVRVDDALAALKGGTGR
ncbi:SDR family NAD(P)-dependent oxidoreductase [Streptomyces telluris]|uniref:SDR family NAD(P)-dependent oxidoreductase n=1 Tax=Streptomyces telluris TaxID=2720021 RepID=A0A9X2LEG2_9ACTN|nr:SDR family NAD(P)-dependent oxidoreductase [Streptomyces telluris]MCQ8769834.1 SDR family NAD(P)-dependent oxidoreductase [Streptomyces telluris]NJP76425.1 SDR family NAD(P)-dependent oxidoreductase [Streptomyces telluris]